MVGDMAEEIFYKADAIRQRVVDAKYKCCGYWAAFLGR